MAKPIKKDQLIHMIYDVLAGVPTTGIYPITNEELANMIEYVDQDELRVYLAGNLILQLREE